MKMFLKNHYRKIIIAVAVLNIISTANGIWFFLGIAKFPVTAWLAFNACAPSVFLFLIGAASKRREIMAASVPFLFFFGGLGLFVFGWSGNSLFAQAGHILMVCAIICTIIAVWAEKAWKRALAGYIIGTILFAVILPVQQKYAATHPEYLTMLGDVKFEKMMKPQTEK